MPPQTSTSVAFASWVKRAPCNVWTGGEAVYEGSGDIVRTHLCHSLGPGASGNSSGARVRKALLSPPAATALTTGPLPPRSCTEDQNMFHDPNASHPATTSATASWPQYGAPASKQSSRPRILTSTALFMQANSNTLVPLRLSGRQLPSCETAIIFGMQAMLAYCTAFAFLKR